jgi:hypothetical protein
MLRFSRIAAAAKPKKNLFKKSTDDAFLRNKLRTTRGARFLSLPLPARLFVTFLIGLGAGTGLEVFVCETQLYETVMFRKTERRHDFDDFTVDFRANMLKWQTEDMHRAKMMEESKA